MVWARRPAFRGPPCVAVASGAPFAARTSMRASWRRHPRDVYCTVRPILGRSRRVSMKPRLRSIIRALVSIASVGPPAEVPRALPFSRNTGLLPRHAAA